MMSRYELNFLNHQHQIHPHAKTEQLNHTHQPRTNMMLRQHATSNRTRMGQRLKPECYQSNCHRQQPTCNSQLLKLFKLGCSALQTSSNCLTSSSALITLKPLRSWSKMRHIQPRRSQPSHRMVMQPVHSHNRTKQGDATSRSSTAQAAPDIHPTPAVIIFRLINHTLYRYSVAEIISHASQKCWGFAAKEQWRHPKFHLTA
jgi:hypothetical protein